ncbi:MAG: EAL domain-containing protein [Hahellaceae bacterium]|nr:EAL domain-containing protein [Hahellaceae bacterium]
MQVFASALKPGGYLFLGGSEAIAANLQGQFEVVSKPWRLFRSIPGAQPLYARGVAFGRSGGILRGIHREANEPFQARSATQDRKLRQVLERYGPAQVILSGKADILYSCGETNRYLEMPAGRPVFDLFSLLLPQLRPLVRTLFNQVQDQQQALLGYSRLLDENAPVRVAIRPVNEPGGEAFYVLSLEQEIGKELQPATTGAGESWAVEQLEQELQLTREDLNQTIEKLSLSNEELKAVNEEFMAMNEELQSANEELESSKEELQSLNEELQTTNVTLDAKVLELEKVNDDLSNLFSTTDLATLFLDTQLKLKRFTPASRRILALIESDIGRPLTDIANELVGHDILEGAQEAMLTGSPLEFDVQDRRGSWYIKRVLPYRKVDQCVDGIVLTFSDVTALRRTRDKAEALAARLQKQAQLLDLPLVFARDLEDRIIFWNQGAQQLYGWSAEEAMGQVSHTFLKTQFPEPLKEIRNVMAERHRWQGELIHQTKSGQAIAVNSQWVLALDGKGQPWATVEVNTDISERKVFEDKLEFLLHHDPLTQLPNQVVLNSKLAAALRSAALANTRVALVFLDLDRFKTINDSLGHEMGNQLLIAVAQRIASQLHGGCTLTRFGGDEFAIVVEGFKDLNRLTHLACTLLDSLKKPFDIDGHELYAGASLGISLFPDDSRNQEELIRYSDSALNLAKEEGRGQYKFFMPELNRKAHRALTIETRLRKALENQELTLVFQPQVSSVDGHILGAEALVRWHNPELGQVSPGEFIPIAEESGIIIELGNWVFEEVFRLMQCWQEKAFPAVRISLNISPVQFRQPAFLELIKQRMAEAQFPASMIELELTERVLVGSPEQAIECFGQLQRLGLRLAFDDFGTGYCSLQYLRHLRLSHLKVAREFIPFDKTDLDNIAIARSIISLAKSLEIDCTVEGVESEAQLAFFEAYGELAIQGFLFSRPLPLAELETLLRAGEPLQPRKR